MFDNYRNTLPMPDVQDESGDIRVSVAVRKLE